MTTSYDLQAEKFLADNQIKFRATLSDSKPCPWKDHDNIASNSGHHYRVTLSKHKSSGKVYDTVRLTFDFWGSTADAEKGITTVTPYEVLACISSDATCPETFEDFCELGYEQDGIKALQMFRRCCGFGKRLRAFFTEAEREHLSEIV